MLLQWVDDLNGYGRVASAVSPKSEKLGLRAIKLALPDRPGDLFRLNLFFLLARMQSTAFSSHSTKYHASKKTRP